MGGGHHQQQSYQHQQHYGNMGWNQNWNAGNGVGMQASAQNNGNWGTPYGSAQQWGISSKAEFVRFKNAIIIFVSIRLHGCATPTCSNTSRLFQCWSERPIELEL